MVIVVAMLCFVHVVLQIFIELLQTLQEQLLFFLRHSGGHSLFGLQNVLVARLPHFRAAFCQANMLDAPVARVGEAFYQPFLLQPRHQSRQCGLRAAENAL